MPTDGGFGAAPDANGARFGNGRFNVPPLFEAADTAPLFHNNAAATIEDAVAFYSSAEFLASPGSNFARPHDHGQARPMGNGQGDGAGRPAGVERRPPPLAPVG